MDGEVRDWDGLTYEDNMPLKFILKTIKQHLTSVEDTMAFGKHKGVKVEDVLHDEPGYFDWLFEKEIITATPEMTEIINNAILNHMDDRSSDYNSIAHDDWEIPY